MLAEEGPDPAGMGVEAEETQPWCGWDLPASSLSTAAQKAGEVGRVMPDQDPSGGLPRSPTRGSRPELFALLHGLRAISEISSAQRDEKDPSHSEAKVMTETRDHAQATERRVVLNPAN